MWVVLAAAAAALLAPADAKSDLRHLRDRLAAAQYDLFANATRAEFEAAYKLADRELSTPHDRAGVQAILQRFTATARIAHTRIDFLGAAFANFQDDGGKSFPFEVRIDGGRMYVTANRSADPRIAPGDEIVTIAGRPARDWARRYRLWVSADTDRLADTITEYRLAALLWLDRGERKQFNIGVRTRAGKRFDTSVRALANADQQRRANARARPFSLDPGSSARILAPSIAYLRPGPFYNAEPAANAWDNTRFVAMIDKAFADFAAAGATSLIIDLRDNPGGDSSFSDPMIAYIADKPWRFASRFTVRVSPEAIAANRERIDAAKSAGVVDPVSPIYSRLYSEAAPGSLVEFPIIDGRPRETGHFAGKVYALIDRYCFSNCANVAALLQDYGFATILGEATADLVTTQGAMEHFTLPRTGIRVGFAKARIVRPSGEGGSQVVIPDVEFANPVAPASDIMLAKVVDYVRRAALHNRPRSSSRVSGLNGSRPEPGKRQNSPNHSRPPTS